MIFQLQFAYILLLLTQNPLVPRELLFELAMLRFKLTKGRVLGFCAEALRFRCFCIESVLGGLGSWCCFQDIRRRSPFYLSYRVGLFLLLGCVIGVVYYLAREGRRGANVEGEWTVTNSRNLIRTGPDNFNSSTQPRIHIVVGIGLYCAHGLDPLANCANTPKSPHLLLAGLRLYIVFVH